MNMHRRTENDAGIRKLYAERSSERMYREGSSRARGREKQRQNAMSVCTEKRMKYGSFKCIHEDRPIIKKP